MIASCEMDHRSVGLIHLRRSSFIDSNWGKVVILFLLVYNSNFIFLLLRYAVFFLQDFSASSTISSRLTQIAHWKQRTVFFFYRLASYYFTPAYIITSLAHRRFGFFLSNMTCGWEVDTNFKLFWCVTFLVFPISASSDSLHCAHCSNRSVMNSFRNSAIEVIQRGLCRIGV